MSVVHGSLVETPQHNNHNYVVLLVHVNISWSRMNRAFYAAPSIKDGIKGTNLPHCSEPS